MIWIFLAFGYIAISILVARKWFPERLERHLAVNRYKTLSATLIREKQPCTCDMVHSRESLAVSTLFYSQLWPFLILGWLVLLPSKIERREKRERLAAERDKQTREILVRELGLDRVKELLGDSDE